MHGFEWTSLTTCAALALYIFMGSRVGRARAKYGVAAPAMSGDPIFERHFRVHLNTLEWLPVLLVSMWLFALYWSDQIAAGIGAVWIIGRIIYMTSYVRDPKSRSAGFGIQALATLTLLGGGVWGAIAALIPTP